MQKQHKLQTYKAKINHIVQKMIYELFKHQPEDYIDFMVEWLNQQGRKLMDSRSFARLEQRHSSDEGDDEEIEELPVILPSKKNMRTSVSAEVYGHFNKKGDFQARVIEKSEDQKHRILDKLLKSFMFSSLDNEERQIVIDAMEEKRFNPGDFIINQGDDGNELYVVDSGELECYRKQGDTMKLLRAYNPGDSFGELALLYNCPRAASIQSKTESVLFALDRATFNNIVKESAIKQRERYEDVLSQIDILKSMGSYERMHVCDGLKSEKYEEGDIIINEGEEGDRFYMIEKGELIATQKGVETKKYKQGDYFGELALLKNIPRQATITAISKVKLVERCFQKTTRSNRGDPLKKYITILNIMIIFLFALTNAKLCQFNSEIVFNISECSQIEAIDSTFKCVGGEFKGNLSKLNLYNSTFDDCIHLEFNVDGRIDLNNISFMHPEDQSYYYFSGNMIEIQNQISSKQSLLIFKSNSIKISIAQISVDLLGLYSQNIEIYYSTLIAEYPTCKTGRLIDFIVTRGYISGTYKQQLQMNIKQVKDQLNVTSEKDMFFKLMQQTHNYSLLIIAENNFLFGNSRIYSNKVAIYSNNIDLEGMINGTSDCYVNEGIGRGPEYFVTDQQCYGSGGSSAGRGGLGTNLIGSEKCYKLGKAAVFFNKLSPYNSHNSYSVGSAGSGNIYKPSGGGLIKLYATGSLKFKGTLSANGIDAQLKGDSFYQGGGGGGVIIIKATTFDADGKMEAKGGNSIGMLGEGGGGLISLYYEKINGTLDLNVQKGQRFGDKLFFGQDGTIHVENCPANNIVVGYRCVPCQEGYFIFGNQCSPCPGIPVNSLRLPICNKDNCDSFDCDPIKFISAQVTKYTHLLSYLVLIIFIVAGYVVRRVYRMREQIHEQLPFDFDTATKDMVLDHLLTDPLIKNNSFQLVDLMYHAHRITFGGNNTYQRPWKLPLEAPEEIQYLIDQGLFKKFSQKVNKMCEWDKKRQYFLYVLQFLYYPLYWWYMTTIKRRIYRKVEFFINQTEIKFIKQMDEIVRIKLSKSADYTLLYIDIFNYKVSDLKYFFLSCPYIILLSGEGTFLRPLYLCESNPFLTCLYFAINRVVNQEIVDERNKIMENLVHHKKRMENSQQFNHFIIKFNRYARAIDLSQVSIAQDVACMVRYVKQWNMKFFEKLQIKISVVILQNGEVSILDNHESVEFYDFVNDCQHKDFRFGLFVFDTEVDVDDVDEAIENKKISFYENLPKPDEEEEFDIQDLKEQYMRREKQTFALSAIENNIQIDKEKKHTLILRLQAIRPIFLSHRIPFINKYSLLLIHFVLALLDAILLPILALNAYENLVESRKVFESLQLFLLPYPLSYPVSQLLGCFWMSSQSYGIAKTHLIFNTLSIFNIILYIGLNFDISLWALFILIFNLGIKLGLNYSIKRVLSLNIKLNKINQSKHIIQ